VNRPSGGSGDLAAPAGSRDEPELEETYERLVANGHQRPRAFMLQKNTRLFALDTVQIAKDVSSLADLQQRMQGIVLLGVFLRVTPFQGESGISEERLFEGVENSLRKYFGKRGEQVVQDNLNAVMRGYREVVEVPRQVMESTAQADGVAIGQ
jgi:pyruvate-ferredoxin/flavodoxin oxidoreductase